MFKDLKQIIAVLIILSLVVFTIFAFTLPDEKIQVTDKNEKHPNSIIKPLYWNGEKLFPYSDDYLEESSKRAYDISISLYEKKKYEEAIKYLEFSDYILPTGKSSDQTCTVYSAKGDFKEAIKWCKQAVDLGYEESITGLGTVYASNKDYDNALIWLIKGDELNQPKASTNLGFVYSRLGDLRKKAEEYYLKAIKNYPKDIVNVSNIIHFYHKFLKDNVKASAWAIAGVGNVFDITSVVELLAYNWRIPVEDIVKGRELQLTSDEFPYKNNEDLSIFTTKDYEDVIKYIDNKKKRGF